MKQDEGPTYEEEIKIVMAEFCSTAGCNGNVAAEHAATVHLVAAAAYLEETIGPERTRKILSAAISSIGLVTTAKH